MSELYAASKAELVRVTDSVINSGSAQSERARLARGLWPVPTSPLLGTWTHGGLVSHILTHLPEQLFLFTKALEGIWAIASVGSYVLSALGELPSALGLGLVFS